MGLLPAILSHVSLNWFAKELQKQELLLTELGSSRPPVGWRALPDVPCSWEICCARRKVATALGAPHVVFI